MQLLRIDWNVIFTIVNLIVLYLGLRKFLIGPVTKVMDQRKQLIEGQMADARHVNEQANELKARKLQYPLPVHIQVTVPL